MAKPNNRVKKAFALSAVIDALLTATNNGNPKLTGLKVKIVRTLREFSVKSSKDYYMIYGDIRAIWLEMAKRYDNKLDEDEIEVFIEMLLSLAPREDIKAFLGVNFTTRNKLRDCKKSELLVALKELDEKLNKMFGTTATATRESLGAIMVKPIKSKAVKKERQKAIPKKSKRLKNRIRWVKDRIKIREDKSNV